MTIKKLAIASFAVVSCAVVSPSAASASAIEGFGTWEGSGTTIDLDGSDLGPFSISLVRKASAQNKVRTDGKVTLSDGRTITFWQEFEDHGSKGFKLVSNNGSGGGHCFANGMCQTYEQRPDGAAFATTITKDGTDKIRILVTELSKGQAVRFFQQSLTRKL